MYRTYGLFYLLNSNIRIRKLLAVWMPTQYFNSRPYNRSAYHAACDMT